MLPKKPACTVGALLMGAIILVGFVPVTADSAPSSYTVKNIDGVEHMLNPSEPSGGMVITEPKEVWRIGGEDDEEGEMLGRITDIRVDADGNIYLLDSMVNTVKVVSSSGEFLRDIGRSGQGPGEWNNATSFLLTPEGRVGVVTMMPSKIIQLEKDGTPAASFDNPAGGSMGMGMIRKAEAGSDCLFLSTLSPQLGDGATITTVALARYDMQGDLLATYCSDETRSEGPGLSIQMNDEENFSTYWAVGRDNRLFVSPRYKGYRIDVYNPDGTLVRVLEREYESVRRSDEDMEERRQQAEEIAAMFAGEAEEINPYGRDIRSLLTRPNGELWVVSGAGLEQRSEGLLGFFDVFDTEGRFVRQHSFKTEYNPDRDMYVLTDDYLFILTEGQSAPSSTSTSSGGGGGTMMMVQIGSNDDEDEDGEAAPYGVICYKLEN